VTGHREVFNPSDTYKKILKYLIFHNPSVVNIGGAKGFDSLVMRACYFMKIPYVLYLPYKGFVSPSYKVGNISYKDLYDNALEAFYEAEKYTNKGIYQLRNKKIVDNSNELLCYWNGEHKGGTYNTIKYAMDQAIKQLGPKKAKNIYFK
jgi:hypothetical protein